MVEGGLLMHCKQRFTIFPSPAGLSLTKLSLAGNYLIIPGQGVFGDVLAGDGKIVNFFLQGVLYTHSVLNLKSCPHFHCLLFPTMNKISLGGPELKDYPLWRTLEENQD
jgi:hypothetical protein